MKILHFHISDWIINIHTERGLISSLGWMKCIYLLCRLYAIFNTSWTNKHHKKVKVFECIGCSRLSDKYIETIDCVTVCCSLDAVAPRIYRLHWSSLSMVPSCKMHTSIQTVFRYWTSASMAVSSWTRALNHPSAAAPCLCMQNHVRSIQCMWAVNQAEIIDLAIVSSKMCSHSNTSAYTLDHDLSS